MARRNQKKWHVWRKSTLSESNPEKALDAFFALDRRVVELSMKTYNIPRAERFKVREQNRRLHQAVKEQMELARKGW